MLIPPCYKIEDGIDVASTRFGEILYIIGVSLFFIGWFSFCFWIWWEFF